MTDAESAFSPLEMNRQTSLKSEQVLETECLIRSAGKERIILLFHSTILQGDCHFVEEFANFERRSNNDHPNVEQRYLEVGDPRDFLSSSLKDSSERILQGIILSS